MSHAPYYDPGSATVCFWVEVGDTLVGATIGKSTLHYRWHKNSSTDDPLSTYTQNAAEIDAVVRRRLAAGSREPIMLRDADVIAPLGG
jgi:hypothetical protein